MPYVKLDCGILDSTVWIEHDTRNLFLTALLMSGPREYTEPVATFEVDSNEPTGWNAPPGWYGFIEAAGPGIIRRAIMEQKPGMTALRTLCGPDLESRSPRFEGRRLARVKGGYIVLNFMEYRDRDYTMAERAKRYRQRKKGEHGVTPVTRDSVTSRRNVTQSESESDIRFMNPVDNVNNGDNFPGRASQRVNGAGAPAAQRPRNGTDAEAEKAWLLLTGSDGKIRTPQVQAALEAMKGGWPAIKMRTPKTEPELRSKFLKAFAQAEPAAA